MIILGYERLEGNTPHRGWNFNGRYEPSRIQLSDEQIARLPMYEGFIYRNVIAPERFDASHRPILAEANSLRNVTWTRKMVQDIQNHEVYFYPIEILGLSTYTKFTSHISINPQTLNDIRQGRAYLLFSYLHEGNLAVYEEPLKRFCELISELQIPKEQILMFHGDHDSTRYQDMPFRYYPANGIYTWLARHRDQPLIDYTSNKLFLVYARNTHHHRIMMLKKLRDFGLLERGLFSFGTVNYNTLNYYNQTFLKGQLTEDDLQFFLRIQNTSPDNKNFHIDGCQQDIQIQDHRNTFVSIITETLPENIFITEKTYKAMAIGHPFLILSGKGTLAQLKKDGFQTFSDWWDETYDEIDDWAERTHRIAEIVERLNFMSTQMLKDMRHDMQAILVHNQNRFRELCNNPYGPHRDIAETLMNIVNNR